MNVCPLNLAQIPHCCKSNRRTEPHVVRLRDDVPTRTSPTGSCEAVPLHVLSDTFDLTE